MASQWIIAKRHLVTSECIYNESHDLEGSGHELSVTRNEITKLGDNFTHTYGDQHIEIN
jgi:hypothetical protein